MRAPSPCLILSRIRVPTRHSFQNVPQSAQSSSSPCQSSTASPQSFTLILAGDQPATCNQITIPSTSNIQPRALNAGLRSVDKYFASSNSLLCLLSPSASFISRLLIHQGYPGEPVHSFVQNYTHSFNKHKHHAPCFIFTTVLVPLEAKSWRIHQSVSNKIIPKQRRHGQAKCFVEVGVGQIGRAHV